MNKLKVAIHQPNYIPWLGFFYKMLKADIFILLDNVQFSKNSYQNRAKIKTSQGVQWLTQPISIAGNFGIKSNDVKILNYNWYIKHLKTLKANYARSDYWYKYEEELISIYERSSDKLAKTNEAFIKWIADKLSINTQIKKASDSILDEIDPTERLIKLVKSVGGNIYICGSGASNYQDV